MSAIPAVRAPAGSGPLLELARSLWPLASERWGISGGVLEGVGSALAEAPVAGGGKVIWPAGERFAPPVAVAGLGSADVLVRAIADRSGVLQYRPRIFVVEPRAEVALAAIARYAASDGQAAARDLLGAPGVEWFIGPLGMSAFQAWLTERVDDPLPKDVIPNGAPPELATGVAKVLGEAHARQQALMRDRVAMMREGANSRQRREAVRARWREGKTLRILVSTTRFSTYMRHAAADLVDALDAIGHEARLLLEPDDHTRQTQLHYTRAVAEFDPDGVVLLNFFRPQIGPVLPPHVPVVTWSQDAMPHYFTGASPPRVGTLDYVVGMLYPELRTRVGLPEERMLAWPNAVSPAKFHREPVGEEFEHLRCDVAMMTRHSELPAAYVRRKIEEAGGATPTGRAIAEMERLVPIGLERAQREHRWTARELRARCEEAIRSGCGRTPPAAMVEGFLHEIVMPLADLHYRQQSAVWAAAVCERNGWRLHLYGNGWEEHPELAEYARGELGHGEELRAAYQLAGVTIHASVRGLMHQRVAEAAMSGGLPVVRRSFEDVDRARWFQLNAMVGQVEPDGRTEDGRPSYVIANHDGLIRVAALWGRCGLTLGDDGVVSPSAYEMGILKDCPLGKPRMPEDDPAVMLVDVGEIGFASEDELERIARKARDTGWREHWSASINPRVRERFAMDRFADAMIGLVRKSFV
ncbi:MAG: hypothetical protein NCW75_14455 [Phycisphaera sp.]|nr:MAG: hypothetical protein NCW75_14455 [Phycisphaera sp.]